MGNPTTTDPVEDQIRAILLRRESATLSLEEATAELMSVTAARASEAEIRRRKLAELRRDLDRIEARRVARMSRSE